jgi:hypothetical protein
MKNDNTQVNHRGGSPPFQDPESDFFKWMNSLKSMGQRDERDAEIRKATEAQIRQSKPSNRKDDSRWQDDGGEGG